MIGGHPSALISSSSFRYRWTPPLSRLSTSVATPFGPDSSSAPTPLLPLPSGRSLSFSSPTFAPPTLPPSPSPVSLPTAVPDPFSAPALAPSPPATLAEFTLNGHSGLDFYDVSLVDGYNLPVLVVSRNGRRGGCSPTGCLVDLNGACPREKCASLHF